MSSLPKKASSNTKEEPKKPYRIEGVSAVLENECRKVTIVVDVLGRRSIRVEALNDELVPHLDFSVEEAVAYNSLKRISGFGIQLTPVEVKGVAAAIKMFLLDAREKNLFLMEGKIIAASKILDAFVEKNRSKFSTQKLYDPSRGHMGFIDKGMTYFAPEVFESRFGHLLAELKHSKCLQQRIKNRYKVPESIGGVRCWFYCFNLKGVK